jgi:hypothetical protein
LSVSSSYRPALIASFDALKQVDGVPVTRLERREARALLGDEGEDGDEEESEESELDGDGDGDDFGEDFGDRKTPHGFVLEKTPRSNQSAAAAAAAALAMADDDTLLFDDTLEPTTEASLASELAELERETRAVRAALDANDLDGDVFFSSPPAFATGGFDASHRPARLLEKDRAANRAAARLEETRDALVDVEARVRHAKKRFSLQASAEEGGGDAAEATPSDDDGTKR